MDISVIVRPPHNRICFIFLCSPLPLAPTPAAPAPTSAIGTAKQAAQNSSLELLGLLILSPVILFIIEKISIIRKMENQYFKNIPVSLFLATSIVVVFSLYLTTAIKTIPCEKDIMSIFIGNFIHIDPYHLLANLFGLYSLARIERQIGTKRFIGLLIFLLLFTSITEVAIHKLYDKMPCSIGFSGVLFGLIAWEMVTNRELDFVLLTSIIMLVAAPSINNPKASLTGHAVGAISGIIGGIIWKKLSPVLNLNGS